MEYWNDGIMGYELRGTGCGLQVQRAQSMGHIEEFGSRKRKTSDRVFEKRKKNFDLGSEGIVLSSAILLGFADSTKMAGK